VRLKVRYVGRNWKIDKKAVAGAKDLRTLMAGGGPRRFFERVANHKTEMERIQALQGSLKYYGNKGARDTLIELGLAKNCLALDARIAGLLEKLGARVPQPIGRQYQQIERELIHRVAKPLGLSGAQLDRILFQNYDSIRADILIAEAPNR